VNQPLIPGYLAVRAMAFQRIYDGYIDRYPTAPNNYLAVLPGPVETNINTEHTYGGRIALEAKPIEEFSATLSATYQNMVLGAPFTFDEPPGSLNNPIQSRLVGEASTDSAYLYALTLKGDIQSVHLTSSTSYFNRTYQTGEDDSKAMTFFFPLPGNPVYPSQVTSRAVNHNFVEETRASWSGGPVHALVGGANCVWGWKAHRGPCTRSCATRSIGSGVRRCAMHSDMLRRGRLKLSYAMTSGSFDCGSGMMARASTHSS